MVTYTEQFMKRIKQPLTKKPCKKLWRIGKLQILMTVFFYRAYEEMENGSDVTLLFCHQTQWQKDLLRHYGQVCLLDATYKITKYSIPLFFLAVKTNVGYSVVGTFVIQAESTRLIQEALSIFKEWLPDWKAKFWMTDFSEAEISAIENTFPDSTVYLCAFHREQAWQRWLRKTENSVSGDPQDILNLWRNVANSSTKEQFHIQVNSLKNSDIMKKNPKAEQYFSTQWLSVAYRWVQAFREKDYAVVINTTNGVESQNRVLKYSYLYHNSAKSLTAMLTTVIKSYLPDSYKKYCLKNTTPKLYNPQIPKYLHNRPESFIKHVLPRLTTAETEYNSSSIEEISEGLFGVPQSNNANQFYIVNFDEATCTCQDFIMHRLPCKHMCAVFQFVPSWDFDKMNAAYKNHPCITLDAKHSYYTHSNTDTTELPSEKNPNKQNTDQAEPVIHSN
ncbi:uncharacterized protein LOC134538662 [Bacillus rossius redtenbacheri]|uniref:uncharacterized protein LOC134538662 n=1 Tax=Bacillus rossius redtenbacheri TaxID=93214 RepID=UPI002FDCC283